VDPRHVVVFSPRTCSFTSRADTCWSSFARSLASTRPNRSSRRAIKPSPPRLVAGAEPRPVVTLEVFIEEDQIAPVRIVLELGRPSVHRPPSVGVGQERTGQPAGEFSGHFEQRHVLPRTGRTLNLEVIAVEAVQVQERPDQQGIDGHPDGAPPVGVTAEHPGIRFARQVLDLVFLTTDVKHKAV
jgi:hypothetical protein